MTRLTANAATLVLVIPVFFLLKEYVKRQEKREPGDSGEGENAGKEPPEPVQEIFYLQAEKIGLSKREQEVAWLIYRGFTNLQIAEELYISEATVKKHAGHIYEKMEISGRKALRDNRTFTSYAKGRGIRLPAV